jgi:hypothetical protein
MEVITFINIVKARNVSPVIRVIKEVLTAFK